MPSARAKRPRGRSRRRSLEAGLGVATGDAAEACERQRRDRDAELTTLRKAAAAIPWAGLQERIAALVPRRHGGARAGAQQSLSSHESLRVSSLDTETSTLHLWLPVHAPTAKVAASSAAWKRISSTSSIGLL